MSIEDFLGKLDPKTRKRIQTAQSTETIRLPMASVGLTDALGGGIGAGRLTTVYGNTSAGKSLLLMQSIAQWQKEGLICAYADSEMTYDKNWAARLGIDNDNLILIQKRSVGAMTDEVVPLIQAGIDVIVIDSISDLLPEAFVDEKGEMNEFAKQKQIGAHARSISIMINALHYVNDKTAIVALSQTTTDLSGKYPVQIPQGGKKLGFASSQIIKLSSNKSDIDEGELIVGDRVFQEPNQRKVTYTVEKNKMAPAGKTGYYDAYFAGSFVGIDRVDEIVRLAERYGAVEKSGNWYKYNGESFNGVDQFVAFVKKDTAVFDDIHDRLTLLKTGELPDE